MPSELEPARDLLGIVRAMHAAAREHGAGQRRIRALAAMERELVAILDVAGSLDPREPAYRTALGRAQQLAYRLRDLADVTSPLEPVLEIARKRVIGK